MVSTEVPSSSIYFYRNLFNRNKHQNFFLTESTSIRFCRKSFQPQPSNENYLTTERIIDVDSLSSNVFPTVTNTRNIFSLEALSTFFFLLFNHFISSKTIKPLRRNESLSVKETDKTLLRKERTKRCFKNREDNDVAFNFF